MPLHLYECPEGHVIKLLRPFKDVDARLECKQCGNTMERKLPTSINAVTKEMKDPRRGVSHSKGLKQQLTKRMNDHHDRHDVIQKIDEFGVDDTKRLGWDKKVKRT